MHRSEWLTRAAGVALSSGLLLGIATAPAHAVSERHFIHITTHGLPIWEANAELYSKDGKQIHIWHVGNQSGGSERWNFTWYGGKEWLDVGVRGKIQAARPPEGLGKTHLSLDRDYCFQIDAGGKAKYTGDSKTGNCH